MEIVAGVLAVLLLLWVCSGSKSGGGSDPRDLRISRNTDGLYYIYDHETGSVLGTYPDRVTAQENLRAMKS